MLHVRLRDAPSNRALFGVALAGIFLPCLSAPVVILLAAVASARGGRPPEDRPWARALWGLALLDVLLGVGALWFVYHPEAQRPDPVPRGVLGVVLDPDTLTVRRVRPASPAEEAGVLPGDAIAAIDDRPVATRDAFGEELGRRELGVERRLTVVRAGERRELRVVPRKMPPLPLFEPVDVSAESSGREDAVALVLSLGIVASCFRTRPGARRWRLWGAYAAAVVASMGLPVALGYAMSRALGGWSIGLFLVSMTVQSLTMLALSGVAMKFVRPEPAVEAPRRSTAGTVFLGAWYAITGSMRVGFVVLLVDTFVLGGAIPFADPIRRLAEQNIGALGLTLLALDVVVLGPVAEEMLFRGFLLPRLVPQVGTGWAVAASSALFALLHPHYGAYAVVPLFFGLVFAWARLRSTLVAPVALHMIVNGYVTATLLLALV